MKTIKQICFIAAGILLFVISSCTDDFRISGNGIQATEGRITGEFTRVKSAGAFQVHISNGTEYEVLVRTDENLISYIETYVSDETLIIETRGMHTLSSQLPMEVFITTPQLEGLIQSGSGNISSGYFSPDKLQLILSGSGKITTATNADKVSALVSGSGLVSISGTTNQSVMRISGSGQIDAYDLSTNTCKALIPGSGNLLTSVDYYLEATISGSGNILYFGSPEVDAQILGSGKIIKNQ